MQPASQMVTAGQAATFNVVASGTMPLSYQWQKNGTNVGTNSASYTTPATTAADDNTIIRVTVSNTAGSMTSSPATLRVTAAPVAPAITTQPAGLTVTAGQAATFNVVASGTMPLSYEWQKNGANVGTNSSTFSIPSTTTADDKAQILVKVSNAAGSITSGTVTLKVIPPPVGTAMVLTYHNDIERTGQNLTETTLTPSNVNSTTFGKLASLAVDGLVDAEPLYVSNLMVAGALHNVVFVVTEHDSAYAFDADTFAQLWKVSVLGVNETTSDQVHGCGQVAPEIGITSTPVIDLSAGPHGTIFVVAISKDSGGNYHQRLHALDLTTGAELNGGPTSIQATFTRPVVGGQVTFDPMQYKERVGLLLLNGVIYMGWASHCDIDPYTGWVMGYSQSTLQQVSVMNITPNGSEGAIWMAGAGLAADTSNYIYFLAGNGTFDTTLDVSGDPNKGDYGNGFIKLSTAGNTLNVVDYFNMHDTVSESNVDADLGSGGAMVLPDLKDNLGNTWHLAVGAGKDQRIYVVNRDLMGKFNTSNDNAIYQELDGALPGGVWAMPAYFNNTVYYGSVGQPLKAFTIANAKLGASASSQSPSSFGYPGTTPSISANGITNGIVWAIENGGIGVLHAYDATNLATELYNSNRAAGGRDQFSDNVDCKFVTPMIANGKVFVGTPSSVVVFGLLP